MKLFLSYARGDAELVESLQADLERFGHEVWRDVKLLGGQAWWDRICDEVEGCDAIVFALSPTSARSRYCEAELEYAHALARPLLPIMVAETKPGTAPLVVQTTNIVTYVDRGHEAVVGLAAALAAMPTSTPLPATMPPRAEAPMGDVPELRNRIVAPGDLSEQEQHELVQSLRQLSDGGQDIAIDLVKLMRGRHNLYESVANDLDELLDSAHGEASYGSAGRTLIRAMTTQLDKAVLTPILGTGLTDSLVGGRRTLARAFAEEFDYPMSLNERDDLPQVAQFVHVKAGDLTLRDSLHRHLEKQLRELLGDRVGAEATELDQLFEAAWEARDPGVPDPHEMLAAMPCAIYVTAHPAQLLEDALRKAGKSPVTEVCRWRLDDAAYDWPPSPFDTTDGTSFRPSVEQPLVFHVFGVFAWPDTMVITEDDYFKFLIGVTSQRDTRVPAVVRSALADSALLLLGFRLDDWDFRTLWQALVSQEGNVRLRRYKHIAAQVDPAGSTVSPTSAREYLTEYFGRESTPSLDLFWGSVADFAAVVATERSRPQ
jgi:hypothetical protein